jgi:8-oxo-dGTP pyrophosphatase MutT (NUDIX family)
MAGSSFHQPRPLPPLADWQPVPAGLRRAAVLAALQPGAEGDHLLLVVRPLTMPNHPGQIAFPGGMAAAGESPLATALREAHEEVGLPAAAIAPLGMLPARTSSSGILVHCVVARIAAVPLRADPREVDAILTVPIARLRDEDHWSERTPPPDATGRQPQTSPHYPLGDRWLWGLTARFVRDLLACALPAGSPPRP